MKDISARELKGHNILAVERFKDSTRWMIEFVVLHHQVKATMVKGKRNWMVCISY